MVSDQRKNNNGIDGRKPFTQRYAGIIGTFCMILFLLTGSLIWTWYRSKIAYAIANDNFTTIKFIKEENKQIPVIQESIKRIDESFKDFRSEQRSFNSKIDNKLDSIIKAMKDV